MTPAEHVLWSLWITTFAATDAAFVVDSSRTVTDTKLTPDVCAQADRDGHSISGYLAAKWETHGGFYTTVGAIDVDTTIDDAERIAAYLRTAGVLPLMVHSRRGAHLWVWTVGDGKHGTERYMPVPGSRVAKGLQAAVDLTITDPDARAHIEVFPKSKALSPYGVGALRMPLFKHPKDGRVYPVMDGDVEVTDRLRAYRLTIPLDTPYEALYALGGMGTPDKGYPGRLGTQGRAVAIPEGPGVSVLLASMGVTTAHPGRSVRCPFHEDRHASLSILADDQRIICKAPTCMAYNMGRGIGSLALAKMTRER